MALILLMLGLLLFGLLAGTRTGRAQQASTSSAPIFNANAKYVQGVGPGYWPTAGTGLTLNLAPGTSFCGNPPAAITYAGGALTMSDNATNYVYLDPANACTPAASTIAFFHGQVPIAKVVAAGGSISSVTDARTWFVPDYRDYVNVWDYGVKPDGARVTDAAVTNGSATLTSATASFTSADVGKPLYVYQGAGLGYQTTSIVSVVNPTTITMGSASTRSLSPTIATYGTDNTNNFNLALRSADSQFNLNETPSQGRVIYIPPGNYLITAPLYLRKGDTLRGGGGTTTKLIVYTASPNNTLVYAGYSSSLPISNITCSSGTATATTSSPFSLANITDSTNVVFGASKVEIASSSVSNYVGTFIVSQVLSNTTFTFSATCNGTGMGGTVYPQDPGGLDAVVDGLYLVAAQGGSVGVHTYVSGWVLKNNWFEDTVGVQVGGTDGLLTGNTFDAGTNTSIMVVGNGAEYPGSTGAGQILIEDNRIYKPTYGCFALDGATDVAILGNYCSYPGQYGVYTTNAISGGDSYRLTIQGNHFYGSSGLQAPNSEFIHFGVGVHNTQISGNQFAHSAYVDIHMAGATNDNITVSNNKFKDNSQGSTAASSVIVDTGGTNLLFYDNEWMNTGKYCLEDTGIKIDVYNNHCYSPFTLTAVPSAPADREALRCAGTGCNGSNFGQNFTDSNAVAAVGLTGGTSGTFTSGNRAPNYSADVIVDHPSAASLTMNERSTTDGGTDSLLASSFGKNGQMTVDDSGLLYLNGASGDNRQYILSGPPASAFDPGIGTYYINQAMNSFACLNQNTIYNTCLLGVNQTNTPLANIVGVEGSALADNNSGSSHEWDVAMEGDVFGGGNAAITNMVGFRSFAEQDGSGTVTNMASFYALPNYKSAGTVTNNYGLYVDDQTGVGTNNYAVYTARHVPSSFGGAVISGFHATSFSATPVFDASAGNTQSITLTGNVTSSTLSNAVAGEQINFIICQDGTGGRSFIWPTHITQAPPVNPNANACTYYSTVFDGTNANPLASPQTQPNITAVSASAAVATDQNLMSLPIPPGMMNTPGKTFTLFGAGPMTFRVKLCSVSGCGSGTAVTLCTFGPTATQNASSTNIPWNLSMTVSTSTAGTTGTVIPNGSLETVIGTTATTAGSPYLAQTTGPSAAIDLTAPTFVQITVADSGASANNSFTQSMGVMHAIN